MIKSKGKYLIVKGVAGLGDRLHVLTSAIEYSERTNRILLIDWSDGMFAEFGKNVFHNFFQCKYDNAKDLDYKFLQDKQYTFYPEGFNDFVLDELYAHYFCIHPKWIYRFPIKLVPRGIFRKIYGFWQLNTSKRRNDIQILLNIFSKRDFVQGRNLSYSLEQNVVVYADMTSSSKKEIFLKYIELKEHIHQKIRDFVNANNLNSKSIGIHIRATDNQPVQPLSKLVTHLKNNYDSSYTIFIATDNIEVEKIFKMEFEKVIVYEKFLPKVNLGGVHHYAKLNKDWSNAELVLEQSIIDMWLLSRCEYLYYLGNSSFSIISSYLHENKEKQFNWNNI